MQKHINLHPNNEVRFNIFIFIFIREYKTYTEEDFWKSVNEINRKYISDNLDLRKIAESWKKVQPISLLNVKRSYHSDYINVTQVKQIIKKYYLSQKLTRFSKKKFF